MRTSCELGLYPALAADKKPKTLAELAQATGADPTLLRTSPEVLIQPLPLLTEIKVRFLRAGVSFGSIKEIGLDHYGLSPSYALLANPIVPASLPKLYVRAQWATVRLYASESLCGLLQVLISSIKLSTPPPVCLPKMASRTQPIH